MKKVLLVYHGFKAGEIYKSKELFDFFERRIMDKENPFKELEETKGVSMIDSFSVEPVSETLTPKYSRMIFETYKKQERLKEIKRQRQKQQTIRKSRVKVNSR